MRTKNVLAALAALLLAVQCGCQPAPESAIVTSKNDGTLEAALVETADIPAETPEGAPAASQEAGTYTDSFTNTDGDIAYQVELDIPTVAANMPVLRVRPKTITAECAQCVAEVLFGDADIYDHSGTFSKAELEELILSLRQRLSDQDEMETNFGPMKDEVTEQMEAAISKYEAEYAEAPETTEEHLCGWEFHPRSWYYDQAWVNEDDPETISLNKSQFIVATSDRDGLPYLYTVCNREESDYRIHSITCEMNWELIDEDLIYSTQEPTEAEIAEAQAEAEAMLDALDLGRWVIDSCVTQEVGSPFGYSRYSIIVTACPVYCGVKVPHLQLKNLRSDDAYASNYAYEELSFTFSGGNLVRFYYNSPLDVVEVVNENVAILSFEEAMEICMNQMQMSVLNTDPDSFEIFYPTTARKEVDVYQAELGLTRTRVKDNATDFYLLPAYTFRASYTLYDQNGSLLIDSNDLLGTAFTSEMLVINALDGSIINTEMGY